MCVLSRFSPVLLSVILWTAAHQAPLSMGFSRQEYWSGEPSPLPGDLPDPWIEPESLKSPALTGRFFTTSATFAVLVQSLRGSVVCDSLRSRGLQHARHPHPSPALGACSNSCPSSQ